MKTILVDAWKTFILEEGGIFQKMFDLLEKYPNKKIILSNANDQEIEEYGLNKMPYEVFTLKHNPDKTDSKYFQIMLDSFGFNKNNVVYIEHDGDAVKSAQSVGIISYYYDSYEKDLDELKDFLDNNL